jgi:cell division protein FtsZ
MSIEIIPNDWIEQKGSIIKVIGVGGGGNNAVNHMFHTGIKDVDFVVCNTDEQALNASPIPYKLRLGEVLTKGRGAGCDPEQGRKAAEESESKIRELLSENTEMVFITAGMGGGTGTGAAPVIARIAKEMGILTVGIVTLPFRHEGVKFMERARNGIHEMKQHVDSLLVIDNQKLYDIYGNLSIFEAFPKADDVLSIAAKGIAEIITRPGFINVDFADVKMVMKDSGVAIMGTGIASGEQRALEAVEMALSSPLLNDSDVSGARNVLVNITSSGTGKGITMSELEQIMQYVQERTGDIDNCKRGVVRDDTIGEAVSVTVVATGFGINAIPEIHVATKEEGRRIPLYPLEAPETHETDDILDVMEHETDEPAETHSDIQLAENQRVYHIHQEEQGAATAPMPRTNPAPARPALILEKDGDITELEKVPAYLRRKSTVTPPAGTPEKPATEASSRIVTVDGTHKLNNNNSFLYQTQD